MRPVVKRRYPQLLLSGALIAWGWGLGPSQQPGRAPDQSIELALRGAVEKLVSAYCRRDLPGLLAQWSEQSPYRDTYKQEVEQEFAIDEFACQTPLVSDVTLVETNKATLRTATTLTATDVTTREAFQHRHLRNVTFVQTDTGWRVWRYVPAVNDLAEAVFKADSDAARRRLIDDNPELTAAEVRAELMTQGDRWFNLAVYPRARSFYELASHLAVLLGDNAEAARMLRRRGVVHMVEGDYDESLVRLRESLAMHETLDEKTEKASVLLNIGDLHRLRGSPAEALRYFHESLTINESASNPAGTVSALNNIGLVNIQQGDYVAAMENLQRASLLQAPLNDRSQPARIVNNIGLVYLSQGDYPKALENFQQTLAAFEANGDRHGIAGALQNMGDAYKAQGETAKAIQSFRKSLAIFEELDQEAETAITLASIGKLHLTQNKWVEAHGSFARALTLFESLGDKDGIAGTLLQVGIVYNKQGLHAKALELAERSSALAHDLGSVETRWAARLLAGEAHHALGRPGRAVASLDEAIAIVEMLRDQVAGAEQDRQRFFESRTAPYVAMTRLLVEQNQPAAALSFAERAKSRVLLDVLGGSSVSKAMTPAEQQREEALSQQLGSVNTRLSQEKQRPKPDESRVAGLSRELVKARRELEVFQSSLYAAHPELQVQRGQIELLRFEEAGALVGDRKTVLLEFLVAEEKTYLFVIRNQPRVDVRVYSLPISEKDLTRRIERFRRLLATADARFTQNSRQLYDLLILPAARLLHGKERLVIVPDGPLWELPMQALQAAHGRYLLEDYAVSYAPSLTVLREMKARAARATGSSSPIVLAFGNPALAQTTVRRVKAVLMDENLDPLPEAEEQVQSLEGIYGPGQCKVYTGADAREERFKAEAGSYRILHLATHGILNDRSPMYSHLLLAQATETAKEDGLLEAWELMKLDLDADLAVLSACETARGRIGKGEGMIGLTWALFVAGVPATVVSQWKVRSDSTAELMVEFHKRLQLRSAGSSKRMAVAAALRDAALKLREDSRYRHPFHWAGFVAIGDVH